MLNGAIGYQAIEDGTPLSIGLILLSSTVLSVGTGYIALDTGFSWTGYWNSTLAAPNRAYALYTLYQLAPLVFLFVFFILEAYLVLRVLGEKKPMRKSTDWKIIEGQLLTFEHSVPHRGGITIRNRPDLPVHRQHTPVQLDTWCYQRWAIRDAFHVTGGYNDMDLLVEHN